MGEITALVNQYEFEGKSEETYQLDQLRIHVLTPYSHRDELF
jgi:hypothetical protein